MIPAAQLAPVPLDDAPAPVDPDALGGGNSARATDARILALEARLDELAPLVPLLPLVPVLRAFLDTPAMRKAVERIGAGR